MCVIPLAPRLSLPSSSRSMRSSVQLRAIRAEYAESRDAEVVFSCRSLSYEGRPPMPVHPTAIVDHDAIVSPDATVWQFCHVSSRAQIGSGVMLGQSVFIGKGVVVGARSRIQNFSNVVAGVRLEDDVFIGPHVSFTNVKFPRVAFPADGHYLETLVERGASLGANATILPGLRLGRFCLVGAGSVVTRDVVPFALVQGNPARRVGWVSEFGVKLERRGAEYVCPKTTVRYRERGDGLLEEVE